MSFPFGGSCAESRIGKKTNSNIIVFIDILIVIDKNVLKKQKDLGIIVDLILI